MELKMGDYATSASSGLNMKKTMKKGAFENMGIHFGLFFFN